jgi:hypothetical protein
LSPDRQKRTGAVRRFARCFTMRRAGKPMGETGFHSDGSRRFAAPKGSQEIGGDLAQIRRLEEGGRGHAVGRPRPSWEDLRAPRDGFRGDPA